MVLAIISGSLSKDKKAIPVHEAKLSVRDKSPAILKKGEVWGNRVNIREAPSLQSKVLGQVNEGISLCVLGYSSDWYKVEMKDIGTAYIFGAYLRPVNFDTGGIMLGIVKYEKAQVYINVSGAVKKITLPGKTKLLLFPAKGNYKEDDTPNPINYYSLTKLLGEWIVKVLSSYLIIRTSFIPRDSFPYPEAFTDQFTCRMTSDRLAADLMLAIKKNLTGVIHIAGEKDTLYNIARKINPSVGKITRAETGLILPRDLSLNTDKWKKLRGEQNGP